MVYALHACAERLKKLSFHNGTNSRIERVRLSPNALKLYRSYKLLELTFVFEPSSLYIYIQYSSGVDVTSRDGRIEDNEDKEELGAECGSFYSKKNSSRERKTKSTSTSATNCDEDDYGILRRRRGRGGEEERGGGETLRQFGGDPTSRRSKEKTRPRGSSLEAGQLVSFPFTRNFLTIDSSLCTYMSPRDRLSNGEFILLRCSLDSTRKTSGLLPSIYPYNLRQEGRNSFIPVENRWTERWRDKGPRDPLDAQQWTGIIVVVAL